VLTASGIHTFYGNIEALKGVDIAWNAAASDDFFYFAVLNVSED